MTWQRIDENTYIDDSMVTCAEYQLFLDEMYKQGKYYQPDHWISYQFPAGQGSEPILGIRRSDALAFCEWLTKRETSEWKYGLPFALEASIKPLRFSADSEMGYWLSYKTDETELTEDVSFSWVRDNPINIRHGFLSFLVWINKNFEIIVEELNKKILYKQTHRLSWVEDIPMNILRLNFLSFFAWMNENLYVIIDKLKNNRPNTVLISETEHIEEVPFFWIGDIPTNIRRDNSHWFVVWMNEHIDIIIDKLTNNSPYTMRDFDNSDARTYSEKSIELLATAIEAAEVPLFNKAYWLIDFRHIVSNLHYRTNAIPNLLDRTDEYLVNVVGRYAEEFHERDTRQDAGYSYISPSNKRRTSDKMREIAGRIINAFTLRERIAGHSLAFEGIRIVKYRELS